MISISFDASLKEAKILIIQFETSIAHLRIPFGQVFKACGNIFWATFVAIFEKWSFIFLLQTPFVIFTWLAGHPGSLVTASVTRWFKLLIQYLAI